LKLVADLAERVLLAFPVLIGVDLQCHGQPGVPEDELRVAGRNAEPS
jgi:hypothetical protein